MLNRAASVFVPYRCPGCGVAGERLVCEECESKIALVSEPYCRRCGRQLPPGVSLEADCRDCRDGVPFDMCRSAFLYRPPVDGLVKGFKFGKNYAMGVYLLNAAVERAAREPEFFPGYCDADGLVPVPLHPFRRLRRGFNQSEFIADGFAKLWGLPVLPCLVRKRNTPPQSRLRLKERIKNVRGAFAVGRGFSAEGKKLVIVDDVMTSGATVRECALMLKKAGAAEVKILTLVRKE